MSPEKNSPQFTQDERTTDSNPFRILTDLVPREAPPCLSKLIQSGIPEGGRNKGMFSFLTFLRKAYPDEWKDESRRVELAMQLNEKVCDPPLGQRELFSIVTSVAGTRYQYMCQQEPILSLCERSLCESLEFGVNCKPWREKYSLVEVEELNIRHLRKVMTDPPYYIIEVRGVDISMSNEEFYHPKKFMTRVEDRLSLCVRIPKADEWDQIRQDLYETHEGIDAPEDASEYGAILSSVKDFLCQFSNSRSHDDLLRGNPALQDGFICFKAADLQRFLRLHRRQFMDNNELYTLLYEQGAQFRPVKIKGREVKVWMFPKERLNILNEEEAKDYMPVNVDKTGDEF
jgi:Primase C terminal 1 (PriCT-1)